MEKNYDAIVIGSGFGGTITALTIAREFYLQWLKDKTKPKRKVLILERGTWWTTPVGTVQDKEVGAYTLLKNNNQPVQFWSSNNSFRGFIDLLTRCTHHEGNVDGLFELTRFGTKGFLELFGMNDGLTVLRASGVGGGSLVYSNITVQPPSLIFNDSRWEGMKYWKDNRDKYYNAARTAIGFGVLKALLDWDETNNPEVFNLIMNDPALKTALAPKINTGISKIVTRTAGHNPHWNIYKNNEGKDVYQINLKRTSMNPNSPELPPGDDKKDFKNDLWVDRARIFQSGAIRMSDKIKGTGDSNIEVGAHDLSINDYHFEEQGNNQFDKDGNAKNYCERQGRCNVGCLPGARHTLNKQLMNAIYGKGDPKGVLDGFLEIRALCEVNYIEKLGENDYKIYFWQHKENSKRMWRSKESQVLQTQKVVVAAGCLGTNEIMLRSRKNNGIKNLSDKLGCGFSPNGDNFYLLGKTKERVRSTRGPAQSSHAHFNLNDPGNVSTEENVFHMVEDLGIPPALATTVGFGQQLFKVIARGNNKIISVIVAVICFVFKKIWGSFVAVFKNNSVRQDMFRNEDEASANYLLVTTTGREQAKAQIKLGGFMQTPLRMERKKENSNISDPFINDPVYKNIIATLNPPKDGSKKPNLAEEFADPNAKDNIDKIFFNPAGGNKDNPSGKTVGCSHPLGGCRIGANAQEGVVDEFGHVFDTSKGDKGIHEGLYIADASVIPTALGVNPSLSISAICWHIADNIRKELK
jgi:choline dehydrogenase-like flavoprotein